LHRHSTDDIVESEEEIEALCIFISNKGTGAHLHRDVWTFELPPLVHVA
jgi:hypothetical protein